MKSDVLQYEPTAARGEPDGGSEVRDVGVRKTFLTERVSSAVHLSVG